MSTVSKKFHEACLVALDERLSKIKNQVAAFEAAKIALEKSQAEHDRYLALSKREQDEEVYQKVLAKNPAHAGDVATVRAHFAKLTPEPAKTDAELWARYESLSKAGDTVAAAAFHAKHLAQK